MTRILVVATLATMIALCESANATIIGISCQADGGGAVVCESKWQADQPNDLNVAVAQTGTPGHIDGTVRTDTETDPTVTAYYSVDNDTGFAWTGYHVDVSMNKAFTLDAASVDAPTGWTAVIAPPVLSGLNYVGGITFTGGTPITPLGTLDFHYKMTFAGSVDYHQTMTPVPEPTTCALLGMGGLGLLVWRRKRQNTRALRWVGRTQKARASD